MRVWTILNQEQYDYLLENSEYIADPKQAMFPEAYKWLSKKMEEIIKKPQEVTYPTWVWYKSGKSYKPDLRFSGYAERGTICYLLELEVNADEILLSDFDYWHFVLNKWKIANEEEKITMEESWNRIFDLNFCLEEDEEYYLNKDLKMIQGNIWKIKTEQIKSVRKFIAK